jgi:bacillithiol biosynthesis cysteine-adding enzyme BshC
MDGIAKAIEAREAVPVDRPLLHKVFSSLYEAQATPAQQKNIEAILSPSTFTICTAHQPNIFSGYLYFVYKILHIIRIAEELNVKLPGYSFVPVYYMGSEDNDLEELGQVKVDGVKLIWNTKQKGAVGRMKVDEALLVLISQLEGQLGVRTYGKDVIAMLRNCYTKGITVAEATKNLVDALFSEYGLLVLNADNAELKALMKPVFRDDLVNHTPFSLVTSMGHQLEQQYKVQVNPREINLFYIDEGRRERIILQGDRYTTESRFIDLSQEEILQELDTHPERFSPNVVLRALYQETILPDIAFIGGGAEVAYWLELKPMFDHFNTPFPMLVLRNSFMFIEAEDEKKLHSFGLVPEDLFLGEYGVIDKYVKTQTSHVLEVDQEKAHASRLFNDFKLKAAAVDHTLVQHLDALHTRLQKQLDNAGKKLLRAEKKNFETGKNQILKIRNKLFPGGSLQERVENFMPFYADHGPAFISEVYRVSPTLEQQFIISTIQ